MTEWNRMGSLDLPLPSYYGSDIEWQFIKATESLSYSKARALFKGLENGNILAPHLVLHLSLGCSASSPLCVWGWGDGGCGSVH